MFKSQGVISWCQFLFLFHLFFIAPAYAESDELQKQAAVNSRPYSGYFLMDMFNPIYTYTGANGRQVKIQPSNAIRLGGRFSFQNIQVSVTTKNFLSNAPGESDGMDVETTFGSYLARVYGMRASHYEIKSKDEQEKFINLGDRADIIGQAYGIVLLKRLNDEVDISKKNPSFEADQSTQPTESMTTLIQFVYDQSLFKGETALSPQDTIKQMSRQTVTPGVGLLIQSQSSHGLLSCVATYGIGYLEEDQVQTSGQIVRQRGFSNQFLAQLNVESPKTDEFQWGVNSGIYIGQPFDEKLLRQEAWSVQIYMGRRF